MNTSYNETMKTLRNELREAVSRLGEIPLSKVSDSKNWKEQNIDSLALLTIIAIVESAVKIKISDAQALKMNSINEILELVNGEL